MITKKGNGIPYRRISSLLQGLTHREINLEINEIWIDFVAHGEEGPASSWAINAKEGDALGVLMKNGKTESYTRANKYFLVGDATAVPVLGVILEDLPATAKGICIIEVHRQEDEQQLQTKVPIQFIRLHNEYPQQGSKLATTVKTRQLPGDSRRFTYVAADFSSVQAIRDYLRKEQKWQREELYAYPYWKSGVSEDRSAAERRNENEENRG